MLRPEGETELETLATLIAIRQPSNLKKSILRVSGGNDQ